MRTPFIALACFALVALIWLADVLTPRDLAFSVFYIVPIALTGWYVGRKTAVVTAVLCAALWALAELVGRPEVDWRFQVWNGLSRAAIFVTLGVLTSLLVEEREKLRAIDRQREEALRFAAHELRASVHALEAGLPSLESADELGEEQRARVGVLRRQAHSLRRFAEDVLAVARFDEGRLELRLADLDLGELVAQAARDSSDPDRIQLVLPSEPVPVRGDPDRLRLAVEHLVSNAVKYSPAGTGVFVRVSAADGVARVDVRDDGVGIAPADQATLFRKYGRVRNTRTERILGVGLGLYVTRLLAQAHGGTVTAKSVGPGLGSTFSLRLPLASPPPASAPHGDAAPAAARARPVPR